MQFTLTHSSPGCPRLILLFAGWGMSARTLAHVHMPGYDTAVVYGHNGRDDSRWSSLLSLYDEIVVAAWSYGVHSAARWMHANPHLRITARIAVNGTPWPCDDTRGIPAAMFKGTLEGLSEASVAKFHMRMLGGAAAYRRWAAAAPRRTLGSLRDELESFYTGGAPLLVWDKAFISSGDLIIPPAAQRRAWEGLAGEIIETDGPHWPDFNALLRRSLTDKDAVGRSFGRAASTYDAQAQAQLNAAGVLASLAAGCLDREYAGDMLEIGCGTGLSTRHALEALHPRHALLWDLALTPQISGLAALHPGVITLKACDGETAIFDVPTASLDVVFSASTVQWFNSLRGFLEQVRRVLRPGGLAALSTYGPRTMHQVHEAAGTSSRFPSLESLLRIVPPGLEVLVAEEHADVPQYDSPRDVLRHISATGTNCTVPGMGTGTYAQAQAVLRRYPLDNDGKAALSYHPIYLILRRK